MNALAITVPTAEARRIVKCSGMLGSAHDGERLSALTRIVEMLNPHGLRFEDVFAAALAPRSVPSLPARRSPADDHRAYARWCLESHDWNERERDFLETVSGLRRLTEKQAAWLDCLCCRRGQQ